MKEDQVEKSHLRPRTARSINEQLTEDVAETVKLIRATDEPRRKLTDLVLGQRERDEDVPLEYVFETITGFEQAYRDVVKAVSRRTYLRNITVAQTLKDISPQLFSPNIYDEV